MIFIDNFKNIITYIQNNNIYDFVEKLIFIFIFIYYKYASKKK